MFPLHIQGIRYRHIPRPSDEGKTVTTTLHKLHINQLSSTQARSGSSVNTDYDTDTNSQNRYVSASYYGAGYLRLIADWTLYCIY